MIQYQHVHSPKICDLRNNWHCMYLVLSINPSIKVVQINSICRFITEIFTDSKILQKVNMINYWKSIQMEYNNVLKNSALHLMHTRLQKSWWSSAWCVALARVLMGLTGCNC